MQTQRLFEILYILLLQRKTTAKQLAEHFEVSVRTIYRDIDVLTLANIPIYTNKGKHGGIFLMENHVLSKGMLSDEEQQRILTALQTIQAADKEDSSPLLTKLSAIFQKSDTPWINVDFSNWNSESSETTTFSLLREAILHKYIISFLYFNAHGEESTRTVEPLQLLFKGQAWYLVAYCTTKNTQRTFKIKRIRKLTIQPKHFQRSMEPLSSLYQTYAATTIAITLKIALTSAYRVYEEFPKSDIIKKEDHFLIHTKFPDSDMLYGVLLSYGEDLTVLAPESVKTQLSHKITKMYHNLYKYDK